MIKHTPIVFNKVSEMPYAVISQGTTEYNRTGTWRFLTPVRMEKLAPCRSACPAGNNIAAVLDRIRAGELKEAWETLSETTSFPRVCGRVCPHPCEAECNRGKFDEAISIRDIEGFLGAEAVKRSWHLDRPLKAKEKKVAVVGSGPAGLSCAYQLARRGYAVSVFESAGKAGGLLRWGIPEYRLDREILDGEIKRIQDTGVEIRTDSPVNDLPALLNRGFNAICVAIGAGQSQHMDVEGEDAGGVVYALDMLRDVNSGVKVSLGKRIVIVGGGNAAIDAARVSRRLGATEVTVAYRRSRNEMPAIKSEVEECEKEGVKLVFLAGPHKIISEEGRVKGLQCIRMELGKPDKSGRRSPSPINGSEFTMNADTVIVAAGQKIDKSNLPELHGKNRHAAFQTDVNGVFVCGDLLTGPATVAQAIGSGHGAALSIDSYLSGLPLDQAENPASLAGFEELNLNYFEHAVRQDRIEDATCAKNEADRCFSCGACRHCDNCLIFCPDIAVHRNNGSYDINYDYCKGCGICSQECPCNCISMTEEER